MKNKPTLFHPGLRQVTTPGAMRALERSGESPDNFLTRHLSGDWGELCAEDRTVNTQALIDGSQVMSVYSLRDRTKIWIITDGVIQHDGARQATTILLPDEY